MTRPRIFKGTLIALIAATCAAFLLYAPARTVAADSSAWGAATLAPYTSAGGIQCQIFSNPIYGGYCVGNSEYAWQNDITPRDSATAWCVLNGYKIGVSMDTWYTGGGQCAAYPAPSGADVNGFGISHHCYCMYAVKCCR